MNAKSVTPVFQVSDLEASLRHYKEVLGFSEDFRFGNYAGVNLGDACFHLCGHRIHQRPTGGGAAFVHCEEVDLYYAEITGKGASVKAEPRNYDYGMRDFIAVDPDGNHITFGCAVGDS